MIEGTQLAPVTLAPISKDDLKAYAAASLDFNPIHLEDSVAQAAGFPSVIVHGMLSMAFLGDYIRQHAPESAFRVRKLRTRFRKVTFPGDTLTCGGTVKKVLSEGPILLSLWIKNQAGDVTTDGEATLEKIS